MRVLLFCENPYAVDIVRPLHDAATERGDEVMWYIHSPKIKQFAYADEVNWTSRIAYCMAWSPDAIFVPGNIVPYYLPGVKVQIFHGYAAEKKDHWIIRRYFDMYLTQGPYFTEHFRRSAERYRDFDVVETGWTKQDWIKRHLHSFDHKRDEILNRLDRKKIALYCPTFSPKLTSLPKIKPGLEKMLDENPDFALVMKFHPLTRKEWVDEYRAWCDLRSDALFFDKDMNLTELQLISDLVISDTSSAVYEFLLLDRPVVTLDTIATDIYWENITDPMELSQACQRALTDSMSIARRRIVRDTYDPHLDGQCCLRMLEAVDDYIMRHGGVPRRRKVNLWRKYTSVKAFGHPPKP